MVLLILSIVFGSASVYFLLAKYISVYCFRDMTPEEKRELKIEQKEIVKVFMVEKAGVPLFLMGIFYYPAYPLIILHRFVSKRGEGRT